MITLGKAVYTLLSGSSLIHTTVGDNIFPLVIPQKADGEFYSYPLIVYERSGNAEYSRDHIATYESNLTVTVMAVTYSQAVSISESVADVLDNYSGTVAGLNIIDIRLSSIDESQEEGAFIERLQFAVKSV